MLIVFFVVLNFHIWFTFGFREVSANGTIRDSCNSELTPNIALMNTWYLVSWRAFHFYSNLNHKIAHPINFKVHASIYLFVPYLILLSSNIALVCFLKTQRKKIRNNMTSLRTSSSSSMSANKTAIVITLTFVVLTFPALMNDIFYSTWIQQDWGQALIMLFDTLDFTYHALSFPMLMASNHRFRDEFMLLISFFSKNLGLIKIKKLPR